MAGLSQVRALHVLASAGLGRPRDLIPASSVTNEVWISTEHVVRVNRRATGRLHREGRLAPHLPAACGYPGVAAAGAGGGMDWLVMHRVPGEPLAHAWPSLSRSRRRAAVEQVAERLRHVHATPVPQDLDPLIGPQLLAANELSPFRHLEDALALARRIDAAPRELIDRLHDLAPAVGSFDGACLVHGDLTFENVIWDGDRVRGLIDFEWARGAPAELDLDVFLRMCAYPMLHVADAYRSVSLPEDYAEVPRWFASAYPELFDGPRLLDQLELFSLAFDLHELVRFPPRAGEDLPPLHARHRLAATLRGSGHLQRWFARIG